MSAQEGEAKNSHTNDVDIGTFVHKYQRLVELLSPMSVACDAILYIVRWQNYILTLALLLVLCFLLYYPALLFSCLTLSSIAAMGVGRYYSQGKALLAKKQRETQVSVEQLAQEQQLLRRFHKEQKASRKVLAEYRQMLRNAEEFIATSINFLEYLYSIVLWKSSEVSLCVTVLLCMLLVLLCTIHLRTIAVCLPIMVLCINRHFFKRTIDMWKTIWVYMRDNVKLLRLRKKKVSEERSNGRGNTDTRSSPEESDSDEASQEEEQAMAATAAPTTTGTSGGPIAEESDEVGLEPTGPVLRTNSRRNSSDPAGTTASASTSTEADGMSDQRTALDLCSSCNVSFAKLLKRRHDCSYCGQVFCRSCTVKVKRALLGATSPAAFEKSVRVCRKCKVELDELGAINQSTSRAAS